ncbi:MAG: 50S ribosomal protein L13 [Candidatus Shapirobacteria bacterium]|nr:50S ribosomal protein L13 [Candidatus Shapirobacteria bacterium]
MITQKTTVTKGKIATRKWHLVDLEGQVLGRAATKIAAILVGKDLTTFSPNRDDGGVVVAINAAKIVVTGGKEKTKIYYHYSGFPGGLKEMPFEALMKKDPRKVIEHAVAGMIPKNKLRSLRLARLKIFIDDQHPYHDQIKP